ncbi:MAG: ATP-binding cassette domain-containing protein, partial [Hyphomicrobiales bacterium]
MAALLQLRDVSVSFGGVQALSAVGFEVGAGEVVAVIGPNGAGKTSLFNAITGYVGLSAGEVSLSGARIDGLTPHEISSKGVRRTFQNGGLFGQLTVLENVLAGLHG